MPSPPSPAAYTCPWCRTMIADVSQGSSCPGCGAPVDVRLVESRSGWYEQPSVRDMARIQFGRSTVQIEGTLVPVADIRLAGGDSVYFAHHQLLWRDDGVRIEKMPLRGGWKRMLGGLPLIMTQAHGQGHIAFSRDAAGEVIALPIQPGAAVDVREHVFMVATGQVAYDWFSTNIWFTTGSGDDNETHYPLGMFMDRFAAPQQPGLLLLHAAGNAFVRWLAPGQTILVKASALLYKDPTVQMQLHIEQPAGTYSTWRAWAQRYVWLRLFGPGRIAVESNFPPVEDSGNTLRQSSGASFRHW